MGTRVVVIWPDMDELWYADDALVYTDDPVRNMLDQYALSNPHAVFRYGDHTWRPTTTKCPHWGKNRGTVASWYTTVGLRDLIAGTIKAAPEVTTNKFCGAVQRAEINGQA